MECGRQGEQEYHCHAVHPAYPYMVKRVRHGHKKPHGYETGHHKELQTPEEQCNTTQVAQYMQYYTIITNRYLGKKHNYM